MPAPTGSRGVWHACRYPLMQPAKYLQHGLYSFASLVFCEIATAPFLVASTQLSPSLPHNTTHHTTATPRHTRLRPTSHATITPHISPHPTHHYPTTPPHPPHIPPDPKQERSHLAFVRRAKIFTSQAASRAREARASARSGGVCPNEPLMSLGTSASWGLRKEDVGFSESSMGCRYKAAGISRTATRPARHPASSLPDFTKASVRSQIQSKSAKPQLSVPDSCSRCRKSCSAKPQQGRCKHLPNAAPRSRGSSQPLFYGRGSPPPCTKHRRRAWKYCMVTPRHVFTRIPA